MKTLNFAAIAALSWHLCGAGPALTELRVKAPFGPGINYMRAAEPILADHAGVRVVLDEPKGPWATEATLLDKPAERTAVAAGKYATIVFRHLTAKEAAAGLAETVLGYYGAVLVVHPDAPVDDVDLAKWNAYLTAKAEPALRWSTLGSVPKDKDGPVTWSLPDATHKHWPQPFIFAHAFPERLVPTFAKGAARDPEDAVYAVAGKKNGLAMHGFDFVLATMSNAFNPLKVLKINGIAPTAAALADESYPLARPIVLVYGASAAKPKDSGLAKFLAWQATDASLAVTTMRMLVPPKRAAASH